ncbi:MAG: fatty acid desaturase [Polyangiaceae bacterium]|nr:fatty acid desaturase [Polyangiaceae bacterium]
MARRDDSVFAVRSARSSAALRRRELYFHLARLGVSSGVFLFASTTDRLVIAIVAALAIYLAAFSLWHDVMHGVLALPPRIHRFALAASALVMLLSGHSLRRGHLVHHRRPLADDDIEGAPAKRTLLHAIVGAPADAIRLRVHSWRSASTSERRWIAVETLLCFVVAVVLAFELVPGGRVFVLVTLAAQLSMGAWAAWIPHNAPTWLVAAARVVARSRSTIALSLAYHELHHERPDLPTAWLGAGPRRPAPRSPASP